MAFLAANITLLTLKLIIPVFSSVLSTGHSQTCCSFRRPKADSKMAGSLSAQKWHR